MKEKIIEFINNRNKVTKEILNIIGYNSHDESHVIFDLVSKWKIDGDNLHLSVDNEPLDDNYYGYTISSLGALGKQLFLGEKDGLTFVMAYPEDDSWENTSILILDNNNKS